MKSIRVFLVVVLLATMTLTVFLSAIHGYRSSMESARQLFDVKLADTAFLLSAMSSSPPQFNTSAAVQYKFAFQVWEEGNLMRRSSTAPDTAIAHFDTGYQYSNFNNYRWRVFSYNDEIHNRWILTAERVDIRTKLAESIILETVVPVIAGLPLVGMLIWVIVGYGLSPLRKLADQLSNKQVTDLTPLPIDDQPAELTQLVSSMNALLGRLDASFTREKRFAADAAHELRTPISALKVHLHNFSQGLTDGDQNLVQLETAVERVSNIVENILLLHRTAPDQLMVRFIRLDLYTLVQQVIMSLYHRFAEKNIQIELNGESACMRGDHFAIETLVVNLLDNACKYTPAGGQVQVEVTGCEDDLKLQIQDSGPGIKKSNHARVFDRFYRIGGDHHASGVIGCGLGLSIVRHIADLHGATIELQPSTFETGLAVIVCFPASLFEPCE